MSIDDVISRLQKHEEVPADNRAWIVIELKNDKIETTWHGISDGEAFKCLGLAQLDVRDIIKGHSH